MDGGGKLLDRLTSFLGNSSENNGPPKGGDANAWYNQTINEIHSDVQEMLGGLSDISGLTFGGRSKHRRRARWSRTSTNKRSDRSKSISNSVSSSRKTKRRRRKSKKTRRTKRKTKRRRRKTNNK